MILDRVRALGFKTYRDYLRSPHWRDMQARYRASRLPQACLGCNEPNFQLHHRSYVRLGHELLEDLIPLCDECHYQVHAYAREFQIPLENTHAVLRRLFGWTKGQTRKKFRPFSRNNGKGKKKTYAWVPRDRK